MSKYNTRGSTESAKNVDGKGEAHSDNGTDSGRENEKLNESTKAKSLKKLNGRAQPLSGDNRCNSRASGSLYSNSHRNDESENSDFDEFSVRRNVQKKKSSHRHGSYTSRSSNYPSIDVRRSGRQRKSMTENSDDGLYADGSSFRYEGDNRRRSSRSAARSATLSRKYQDRSSPSASDVSDHTLREQHSYRSIRDEEVVDDVNGTEDMYSHIKNRRRSIPRKGNGKMMKAKITEESLTDVETVVDDGEPANDKDYSKVKKDELSIMVDNEETENDEKTGNVDRHETEESSESSSESESDDNKGMKLRDRKERAQQRGPDFGGPSARGKYQLRQRRTLARPVQHVVHRAPQGRSRPRAHPFSRQGYVRKHNSLNAPSSSSSSDETHYEKKKAKHMAEARSQCLPMNFKAKDLIHGALRDRQKVGSSLADIQPMAIDRTILFDKIGGLETHVKSLKEMVLFPLLYPEIFEKYKIQPPRGVLFHGPPGTGKTLVARALANECSSDGKKVAFFMRKGADCLSKWVGESERQLRLLFDQAYSMRPAIIFFDEIDGIAPVRSSKQDQIHSSIVSTLLALMDGLDCRGEVIIVGATNRIDAIDPALRRPGRFDREFFFPLPSFESRKEILSIHTKDWQPAIDEEVISTLAAKTVGYCGADLKALCAETALISLRRRYPQIYNSKNKLLLNVDEVIVGLRDFNAAIKKIVPATQRSSPSVARPLSSIIKPLLNDLLNTAVMTVKKIFPEAETRVTTDLLDSDDDLEQHLIPPIFHSAEKSSGNMIRWAGNYRPRFLIYGNKDRGHSSHLAPALLHSLEHLAHLKLDASALYSVTARTPEESLAAIFSEALKRLPAVLYIPHIDSFWEILSDTLKVSFVSLLDDLEPSTPLLVLATSEGTVEDLPTELQGVFSRHCCTLKTLFMSLPSRAERETFFEQLFKSYAFKDAEVQKPVELCNEVLPEVVVKDNRKLSDAELKRLKKKEEQALRQLRLFLGEIIIKIMRDRRFQDFLQPVDQADAPDYTDVIKHPMDLELMMAKLDDGQYECAQEFLSDIHLITDNALEYNPCNNTENKKLRHCAVALRDFANALIEAEMDSDFETYCQEMVHSRRDRGEKRPEPVLSVLPPLIVSLNKIEEGDETEVEGESVKVIGDGLSVKGLAIKRKKDDVVENGKRIRRGSKSDDSEANSSKEKVDSTVNDIEKVNGDDVIMIEETQQSIIASSEDVVKIGEKTVQIDEGKLKLVFKRLIDLTEGIAAEKLEQLYWSLFRIMRKHVKRWERLQLPNDLSKELDRFETSLKTIA